MNSFEKALEALDKNSVDKEAATALKLCNAVDDLLAACKYVRDNLMRESPLVWEHEIIHLGDAINKAEGGEV